MLVLAEPGDPFDDEHYNPEMSPAEHIETTAEKSFRHLKLREGHTRVFNTNVCRILEDCWPGLTLYDQLRRTWIAESYLCSAPVESGPVPRESWSVCGRDYLKPQLSRLADRAIVACGRKARGRLEALGFIAPRDFLAMPSVGPPEGNKPRAREGHRKIPAYVTERNSQRRRH